MGRGGVDRDGPDVQAVAHKGGLSLRLRACACRLGEEHLLVALRTAGQGRVKTPPHDMTSRLCRAGPSLPPSLLEEWLTHASCWVGGRC